MIPRSSLKNMVRGVLGSRKLFLGIVLVAISWGTFQVIYSMWSHDPCYDEFVHKKYVTRMLEEGVTERYSNWLYNSKTPLTVPNYLTGKIGEALTKDGRTLWFWRRLPGLVWYLLLLGMVYLVSARWLARDYRLGLVALLALEPNIGAHAATEGVDLPFACLTLIYFHFVLRFVKERTWEVALYLGGSLGVLVMAKISAVVIVPLSILASFALLPPREYLGFLCREKYKIFMVMLIACFVLNVSYGFLGFGKRFAEIPFEWGPFIKISNAMPWLRLPFPEPFLTMIDTCAALERNRPRNVVVFGKPFPDGVWYYFPTVFLLKTPTATLLWLLGGFALFARFMRRFDRQQIFIALATGLIWIYFCFIFRNHKGYRYILMTVPLYFVMATWGIAALRRPNFFRGLVVAAAAFGVVGSYPFLGNYLAFSNVFVDKKHSYRYLTDSNIDWNQNYQKIYRLKKPGSNVARSDKDLRAGWNVIQHNRLSGVLGMRRFKWLRENAEPVRHIAYTYFEFYLTEDELRQATLGTKSP